MRGSGGRSPGQMHSISAFLSVKVIVCNSPSLGFVAMEVKAAGYLDTSKNPD